MSKDELESRLEDIKIEEIVWIIYIGIIMYSFYSNYLERKYLLTGDIQTKEKYRKNFNYYLFHSFSYLFIFFKRFI